MSVLKSHFFDSVSAKEWFASFLIILLIIISYLLSKYYENTNFGFLTILGALFGLVLQRSRFCFYCIFTDFFERRDALGLMGILLALWLGTLGYHAVFGAFLPILDGVQLPPDAHIGAVSWLLPVSAFVFGLGMALSGSCISAQLYRLGEGLLTAPVALLGVLLGFALGFLTWNNLYLTVIYAAKPLWLPNLLGYAGSLLLQTVLIIGLIWGGSRLHHQQAALQQLPQKQAGQGHPEKTQATHVQSRNLSLKTFVFATRWPTWLGAILVAFIAVIAYFRVGALGVTAELGSISRTALNTIWPVTRLEGLDGFTGCITVVKQTLLSNNGIFVLSLIVGSLISALYAGQFKPQASSFQSNLRIFSGGILMGWGAMISLGCTVGVLLSGIMAGAVSGWIFALFCFLGAWLGWWLRRRYASV